MRRLSLWRSRTLVAGIAAIALLSFAVSAAFAYWVTTDGSNPAVALAATLAAPTGLALNGIAGPTTVPLQWTAPAGYTATGYTVLRCTGASCTPSTPIAAGACSGSITGTSCTDSGLTSGTAYAYAVRAQLANWVSGASTSLASSTSADAKLVFTTPPVSTAATGIFPVAVAVEDSAGNIDSSNTGTITLAIGTNPSSGVLTCSGGLTAAVTAGTASFSGCAIPQAGKGYTLTATLSSPVLSAGSSPFDITAGTASKLVFTTQPASSQATGTGSFPVTVAVEDSAGNIEATLGTGTITLAIGSNPGGGVLTCSGGLSVGVSSGVASFSGCAITLASNGYTLTATLSSPALTVTSNPFNISAGAASKLVFATQPALNQNIPATGTGSFPLVVAVQDTNGNTLTADNAGSVTLTIGSNPGSGVLSCTGGLTAAVSAGMASFSGCAITKVGTGYTVVGTLSSPSLSATSNAFNITAGAVAGLTFTSVTTTLGGTPTVSCSGTVGTTYECTISGLLSNIGTISAAVTLIDANQNVTTNTTGLTITVALSSNGGLLGLGGVSPASLTISTGNSTTTSPATFSQGINLLLGVPVVTATINSGAIEARLTT